MITSKEAEAIIGATIVFVGRDTVSSDEIPAECRRYRCMRDTEENRELIEEALRSTPSLRKLVHEPRTISKEEAVHKVLVLAGILDEITSERLFA